MKIQSSNIIIVITFPSGDFSNFYNPNYKSRVHNTICVSLFVIPSHLLPFFCLCSLNWLLLLINISFLANIFYICYYTLCIVNLRNYIFCIGFTNLVLLLYENILFVGKLIQCTTGMLTQSVGKSCLVFHKFFETLLVAIFYFKNFYLIYSGRISRGLRISI